MGSFKRITGLEVADDQAHYKDQLQVHAPHALTQLLLQGQGPTLYLEGNHLHT
ncbi:PAS domain S-box-containing protein/diguanylate cyclase [Sesbania bispinosa]|nr:PAS domain S-box-containing protein/diguanylate cyclase [Sesbania bispinosa]